MEVKYPILEWRMGIRQFGISDLGCPRMEEVLRAPAAHGVQYAREQMGIRTNGHFS